MLPFFGVEENVLWLQVAEDYLLRVTVLDGVQELIDDSYCFFLAEVPVGQTVVVDLCEELAAFKQFSDNQQPFVIFVDLLEFFDCCVIELMAALDNQLSLDLLLKGFIIFERFLADDSQRTNLRCLLVEYYSHLAVSAFAYEVANLVLVCKVFEILDDSTTKLSLRNFHHDFIFLVQFRFQLVFLFASTLAAGISHMSY